MESYEISSLVVSSRTEPKHSGVHDGLRKRNVQWRRVAIVATENITRPDTVSRQAMLRRQGIGVACREHMVSRWLQSPPPRTMPAAKSNSLRHCTAARIVSLCSRKRRAATANYAAVVFHSGPRKTTFFLMSRVSRKSAQSIMSFLSTEGMRENLHLKESNETRDGVG